jgi:hypothetical protein
VLPIEALEKVENVVKNLDQWYRDVLLLAKGLRYDVVYDDVMRELDKEQEWNVTWDIDARHYIEAALIDASSEENSASTMNSLPIRGENGVA